jgi:hypothetical protein
MLFLSLSAAVGFAQNATTSLRGVIKDPSGAVVPGATITLENKAVGQKYTATSKASGEYQMVQLPPAKYVVTVTAKGFGTQSKSAELLVNQPATIDFALTVSESTVIVDVTAAAAVLNTNDSSLGGSFDNATIQALPSETRNVPDLLSLQPGVLYLPNDGSSRTGAVDGGRSDQGNVTVDGIDDNDQVNGYAFTGVLRETQDSIEEFRVTTSNATADAGRSSGAQVSMVTKSGTNKYHGSAYEYNRPTLTVSNDYFNKQAQLESQAACLASLPTPGQTVATCDELGNRPPKLIRNIYGADASGFIIKNKLFFFGNYEAQHLREDSIVEQTTPTADYQAGILDYATASGATAQLSPAQITTLDSNNGCNVCNTTAYPSGPGANPNSLAYFNSMPVANGTLLGDNGLTSGSYTFASPAPQNLNTSIARLDYTPSDKHRIFVRGNLQKDVTAGSEQFPGQPPSSASVDNSKGITAGYTWTITQNLINDLRYGYIRQGTGNSGVGSGDYVDFRFLSSPTAETRSSVNIVPVNNIIDNFSIVKGKHNIELGVNWRLIHQNRTSDANSFSSATTNPYWLYLNATTTIPDPASLGGGVPTYGNQNDYEIALANLLGTVPQVNDIFNYSISSATSGSLLADGAPISRHFKANEYEGFIQDSWRILPNFTITAGLRYTLLQTPYETKGQEVIPFVPGATSSDPTTNTHDWSLKREAEAQQGVVYEPLLQFAPGGKYYNKPGFYPENKNNVAPRLAVVYSPDGKTTLRAGAGIYYDHFGEGLVNTFDQVGEAGLSSQISNPANSYTYATAPRYTDRHTIPFNPGTAPSTLSFPFTPCATYACGFAISWGLDSKIKTPYSTSYDLSMQHEFPRGFTVEIAYVGRYGTHLLQDLDLAEPVDFVDPQGGGDYYGAGKILSQFADANGGNQLATIPQAIPYFEHVFSYMANQNIQLYDNNGNLIYNGLGKSATQNVYTFEWAPNRYGLGETGALADMDYYCVYAVDAEGDCPTTQFWQQQYSSLYTLSSIGKSSYNAAQWTLRHTPSHGLTLDVSYTFSKSLDWGSDAERNSLGSGNFFSTILNTWKPYLNKGVSDFDTANLITLDWAYQLPVGRNKAFLAKSNGFVNAILGGWQSSGIFRKTSGLPWSVFEPGWSTNWDIESYGVVTQAGLHAQKHFSSTGNPEYFANPDAINNGIFTGGPIRLPYAGEAGQRNQFRGDGYIDLDSGLTKSWGLKEFGTLKFAWEVYNVTNTNRFDPASIGAGLTSGSLGTASSLIGGTQAPRRMQFALRYDF